MVALGAGEILLTSMDRDGTRQGFDIALTRAIADAVPVPVIASGGVGTLDHLVEGIRDGHATAVLAASIFHFGEHSVREAKEHMARAGPADAARSLSTGANGELRGDKRRSKRSIGCFLAAIFSPSERRSSRSLPQNNSPSAVMKLGAPNMPSRCASSVCARSRCLDGVRCGGGERGLRIDVQARNQVADHGGIVDAAAVAKLRAEHGRAKRLAPALIESGQRDPRRQQAVLREGIGTLERQLEVGAQPLEVAPHVAALRRIEIERRGGPSPAP